MSYANICYFFATLFYVKKTTDLANEQPLNNYLRVCRNLIENHPLDEVSGIKMFYLIFNFISDGCDDIYQHLCDKPLAIERYDFEMRKARFILDYRKGKTTNDWESIFDETSDNNILVGKVDFLLNFSDEEFIYKSYDKNSTFYDKTRYGFKSKYQNPNFEKFCQYATLTMQIFDKGFLNNNLALFQRAFLSVGDYGFYATNYFYGNIPSLIYRDREAVNLILSGTKNRTKEPLFKKFLDLLLESQAQDLKSKMNGIIKQCDLSKKKWWEQLLIKQKGLFEFLNLTKQTFQRTRRIRFFDHLNKVELLPGLRNTQNVMDLLDYGFYLYCKDKEIKNLSTYTSDEEQYGNQYPLQPHFTINDKEVLCDSTNSKIIFDGEEFDIDMSGDLFAEFDRIIELIKECLKN